MERGNNSPAIIPSGLANFDSKEKINPQLVCLCLSLLYRNSYILPRNLEQIPTKQSNKPLKIRKTQTDSRFIYPKYRKSKVGQSVTVPYHPGYNVRSRATTRKSRDPGNVTVLE